MNPEINASDAFIAAWLPGSEGGGIADVIMRNEQEKIEHDFVGRLSFSWPKSADQEVLNAEGADYDPLFALGYGLSVTDNVNVEQLNETQAATLSDYHISNFLLSGAAVSPWRLVLSDAKGRSQYLQGTSSSAGGSLHQPERSTPARAHVWCGDFLAKRTTSPGAVASSAALSGIP